MQSPNLEQQYRCTLKQANGHERSPIVCESGLVGELGRSFRANHVLQVEAGDRAIIVKYAWRHGIGYIKAFPFRSYDQVLYEASLASYLHCQNIAVPEVIPGRNGEPVTLVAWRLGEIPCVAFHEVPGAPIDRLNNDLSQRMLEIVSRFHGTTNDLFLPGQPAYGPESLHLAIDDWYARLKRDDPLFSIAQTWYKKWLDARNRLRKRSKTIIHGDLYRKNVFFDRSSGRISLIDLSDARQGLPEEDLGMLIHLHGVLIGEEGCEVALANLLTIYDQASDRHILKDILSGSLLLAVFYSLKFHQTKTNPERPIRYSCLAETYLRWHARFAEG